MLYSSRDDLVYSDPGHRPEENSGWVRKLVSGKQKKNLKKVKTTNFGRSSVNCDDPFIIGRDRVRHTYAYFSHLFSFFFTITVFFIPFNVKVLYPLLYLNLDSCFCRKVFSLLERDCMWQSLSIILNNWNSREPTSA